MIYYGKELYHHGILGQKWGQRRWQNEDGTLTPAGREHYGYGEARAKLHDAKAAYKNARKNYSKAVDNAVYNKVGLPRVNLTKKSREAQKLRNQEIVRTAEEAIRARDAYKSAKQEYKNVKKDQKNSKLNEKEYGNNSFKNKEIYEERRRSILNDNTLTREQTRRALEKERRAYSDQLSKSYINSFNNTLKNNSVRLIINSVGNSLYNEVKNNASPQNVAMLNGLGAAKSVINLYGAVQTINSMNSRREGSINNIYQRTERDRQAVANKYRR